MTTNIDTTAGNYIVTRNGEVYASGLSERVAFAVKRRLRRLGESASVTRDVDATPYSELGR